MGKNMKSFTINRIIFSVGAVALGIILLIWPADSLLIIAKCAGIVLVLGGLAAGFMFFQDHESTFKTLLLVLAVVMLICGAVIFLHPDELVKLIPTIMGILVVISGLINLGETFVLSRSKYGRWWVSLIIAIITIALGILIINKAFNLAAFITRIAGGVLIFDGASDLWVISRIAKTAKEEAEGAAQEAKPKPSENGETVSGQTSSSGAGAGNAQNSADSTAASDKPDIEKEGAAAAAQDMASGAQNAPSGNAGTGTQNAPAQSADTALQTVPSGSGGPKTPAAPESEGKSDSINSAPAGMQNGTGQASGGSYSASAPEHAPGSGESGRTADEDDDIPEYMRQTEQDTDYLIFSNHNSEENKGNTPFGDDNSQ